MTSPSSDMSRQDQIEEAARALLVTMQSMPPTVAEAKAIERARDRLCRAIDLPNDDPTRYRTHVAASTDALALNAVAWYPAAGGQPATLVLATPAGRITVDHATRGRASAAAQLLGFTHLAVDAVGVALWERPHDHRACPNCGTAACGPVLASHMAQGCQRPALTEGCARTLAREGDEDRDLEQAL